MNAPVAAPGKLQISTQDHVGWIVIDNPARRNAMSLSMWVALGQAIEDFAGNGDVRCIVIRGAGNDAFCAGADISEFESMRGEKEASLEYDRQAMESFTRLQQVGKPTVAAISGFCIGGGVALAISCDLRIAARGSRFGIPAARLGLGYGYPGIKRLTSLVGPARAKRIFFTAGQMPAEEALRIGLVDELVAPEELEAAARQLAGSIAPNAPMTIAAAKFAIDLAARQASESEIAEAKRMELACFDSQDFIEGRRAFMEKRRPNFIGR